MSFSDTDDFEKGVEEQLSQNGASKALVLQMAFAKLMNEEAELSILNDHLLYLQSRAVAVFGELSTKDEIADEDGEIALAVIVLDLSGSLNALAVDTVRRSLQGSADEDYFKVPMERLALKLKGTLGLRGTLLELGIEMPDDSVTDHWTKTLFKKTKTVTSFQGLRWSTVEECIRTTSSAAKIHDSSSATRASTNASPSEDGQTVSDDVSPTNGCSVVDLLKLVKLYIGQLGPQSNKDHIPSIRQALVSQGIGIKNTEHFENKKKYSIKQISDDDIQEYVESQGLTRSSDAKQIGNKIRSAIAAGKDSYHTPRELTESEKSRAEEKMKADMILRQALADASIRESESKAKAATQASIELLKNVDVKSLLDGDMNDVTQKLETLKELVATSAVSAGANFQGSGALLQGLTGGTLDLGNTAGVIQSYESNEDLVASVSGGAALHGICILVDDYPIVSAGLPLIKRPQYVSMLGVSAPLDIYSFKSTQESEKTRFNKSASAGGMSMAESSSKGWGASVSVSGWGASVSGSHSEAHTDQSSSAEKEEEHMAAEASKSTSSAHIVEYIKMPMRSFRIPYDAMRISEDVKRAVKKVNTERAALSFLRTYGSHYPFGLHTVGGVFFRSISMMSEKAVRAVSLFRAAGQQLSKEKGESNSSSASAGGSYMGITASGSANMSNASKSGSVSFKDTASGKGEDSAEINSFFQSSVTCMGPNASTPEAFTELLSHNTGTWAIIDRGNLDQALPIWEFIKDDLIGAEPEEGNIEHDHILKAIRLMKRVWIRRAESWVKSPSPPLLPPLVMHTIQDALAQKKAIHDMVMSICAVIIPFPRTGDRLSMLRALKQLVGDAYTEYRKGSSEFEFGNWWIRKFIALGGRKGNLFSFDVAGPPLSDAWLAGKLGEDDCRVLGLGELFPYPFLSQEGIAACKTHAHDNGYEGFYTYKTVDGMTCCVFFYRNDEDEEKNTVATVAIDIMDLEHAGPMFNGVTGSEWPVSGTPNRVEGFVDWEDQGFGNIAANVRLARHNKDTDVNTFLWIAGMKKHGRHSIAFDFKPSPGDKFWDSPLAVGEVFKIWWDVGGTACTLTFHKLAIKVHYPSTLDRMDLTSRGPMFNGAAGSEWPVSGTPNPIDHYKMKIHSFLSGLEQIPNSKVVMGYTDSIFYMMPSSSDEFNPFDQKNRLAHACAERAAQDLAPDDWEWLLDDFVSFSKVFDIPNYKELDEEDRTVTLRSLLSVKAIRIESDGGRTQVLGPMGSVKIFCPDAATPTRVFIYPPQSSMPQVYHLYPEKYVYRSDEKNEYSVISENDFLGLEMDSNEDVRIFDPDEMRKRMNIEVEES